MKNNYDSHELQRELLNISEKLVSSHDLDSILATISQETTALLQAERCTLFVYDSIRDELWSKIAQDLEIDEIRLKMGQGIAGQVAETKKIINIKNAYESTHFNPEIDELTGYKTSTLLVSPLLNISQGLVGVIEVLNKKSGVFTDHDEQMIGILSNISAIAIEQAQLYEWNKVLRLYNENIIRNISSGVVVIDSDLRITVANRVAERMFAPFTDRLVDLHITPEFEFFPVLSDFIKTVSEQGKARLHRLKINLQGKTQFFNVYGSLLASESDIYGYILLLDDVTKRVELELENKQRENLSLIGNMTSSIIHDLKNPLSIIKAYLQIMNKKVNAPDFDKYFSIIYLEINRLVTMTEEVLNFARGEYDLKLELCELQTFIREVTPVIKQLFSEKSIDLVVENSYEGKVKIDKDKMHRLFFNIASNANDAMETGGRFLFKASQRDDTLLISFTDTGKGIPDFLEDKIFEPFVTHDKATGTGLGMAIVKKIVDAHEGKILIESELGTGTTITVELPVLS